MSTTVLVILIGFIDIMAHLLVTVLVGVYLNRMAKREVEAAVGRIAGALPMLLAGNTSSYVSNGDGDRYPVEYRG